MRLLAAALGLAGTIGLTACASPGAELPARSASPGAVRPVPPASQGGEWRPTATAPLPARHSALAVAVGQEVLVLGGSDSPPCPPTADCAYRAEPLRDAAAYAPTTDTWRRLPPAPLGIQLGDEHAVLGRVVYLLVRPDPTTDQAALLAYDVDRDSWQSLPAPPRGYRRLVATDRHVVAYLSTHEYDGAHGDFGYDPAARTWTALPADPLGPSFDRVMVWAGDRLVLVAPKLVPQPGGADGPSWLRAATYEPTAELWRALPETRQVISGELFPVWDGARLLNPSAGGADGGSTNGYGRTLPFGGWLDVRSGEWADLPEVSPERTAAGASRSRARRTPRTARSSSTSPRAAGCGSRRRRIPSRRGARRSGSAISSSSGAVRTATASALH